MPRQGTLAEVYDYLARFAAAEKHRSLPPLTEAEYAEIERRFAAEPETPGMVDMDVEAVFGRRCEFADIFGDHETGMFGDD